MGEDTMATPEKAGRERTAVPVLPRPDEKTAPVSPEPGKPPGKKSLIQNLAVRLALVGLALGGIGYGISRIAESFPNTQPPSAEETISKENIIQLIKSSFTPVSPEQEQELWKNTKTVDLENHTFTIGFPVDQATIDKSPNLRMNQKFDQSLVIGPPTLMQVVDKLKKQGYKNITQLSGLPKDTQIYYRYDPTKFDASIIAIGIAGVTQGEGLNSFTPAYTNYLITLRDKQTGRIYQGGINALYARPLVTPASYPKDHYPVYEDGTPIKPDEPILQLTTDLQDWDGKGHVLPGQKGQIVIAGIGGGFVSIGDAISDAQKGIYNPDSFFTTSFLTTSHDTLAVTK